MLSSTSHELGCHMLTGGVYKTFPGYDACLELMSMSNNSLAKEEGFSWLNSQGSKYSARLLADLDKHEGICRTFIIELLGNSTEESVINKLVELMNSDIKSDSEVAQETLWFMPNNLAKSYVKTYRLNKGKYAYYLNGIAP